MIWVRSNSFSRASLTSYSAPFNQTLYNEIKSVHSLPESAEWWRLAFTISLIVVLQYPLDTSIILSLAGYTDRFFSIVKYKATTIYYLDLKHFLHINDIQRLSHTSTGILTTVDYNPLNFLNGITHRACVIWSLHKPRGSFINILGLYITISKLHLSYEIGRIHYYLSNFVSIYTSHEACAILKTICAHFAYSVLCLRTEASCRSCYNLRDLLSFPSWHVRVILSYTITKFGSYTDSVDSAATSPSSVIDDYRAGWLLQLCNVWHQSQP